MTDSSHQPSGAEALTSAVRRRIVDLLAQLPTTIGEDGGLSAAEVGERMGLHVTTARFHLDLLVRAGVLQQHKARSGGAGRPRKLYVLAPGSLDPNSHDRAYRALAELLAEAFAPLPDGGMRSPEEAGREWIARHRAQAATPPPAQTLGEWFGKVGETVDQLREWGYTPEVQTENGGRTARLLLADCPFLDLARTQPAVVCGVHRGLLRGTLERLGESDATLELRPFVTPTTCHASVTTRHLAAAPRTAEPSQTTPDPAPTEEDT